MTKEQLKHKYELRIALLKEHHEKMLGLQITPLKDIVKLLELSYSEMLDDLKKLNEAAVSEDEFCLTCHKRKRMKGDGTLEPLCEC